MARPRTLFSLLILAGAALCALPDPAHAAGASQTTWAALDPGDDWAAQVLRSIFPIGSNGTALTGIGAENSVIGQMVGLLSGYILALAAAYMAYATIIQIHRAAETGRVLSERTSSWAPVRLVFALVMMFPLASGFSSGQAAVMQAAMWGIGMARRLLLRDQGDRSRCRADRDAHDSRNEVHCGWIDPKRAVPRPRQRRLRQPQPGTGPDPHPKHCFGQ